MGKSDGHFLWYELMTTDMEAARAFYTDVFGWGARDASAPGMPYTLFTVGKTSVCGLMSLPPGTTGAKPRWMGYVGVDDVDATAKRIAPLGGTVHVPPCDIPGVSRVAVFSDPQMATLGLFKWLIPGRDEPAEPDAVGRVGWHELLAIDQERAFAFYSALFGWQDAQDNASLIDTYPYFSAAGGTIGGMMTKPSVVAEPFWLYHFNVADIDAAAMRVRAAGGQIFNGPMEGPGGNWVADCRDPQDGLFSLRGKRTSTVGFFKPATSNEASSIRFGFRR
jgi:uncharacterized protein